MNSRFTLLSSLACWFVWAFFVPLSVHAVSDSSALAPIETLIEHTYPILVVTLDGNQGGNMIINPDRMHIWRWATTSATKILWTETGCDGKAKSQIITNNVSHGRLARTSWELGCTYTVSFTAINNEGERSPTTTFSIFTAKPASDDTPKFTINTSPGYSSVEDAKTNPMVVTGITEAWSNIVDARTRFSEDCSTWGGNDELYMINGSTYEKGAAYSYQMGRDGCVAVDYGPNLSITKYWYLVAPKPSVTLSTISPSGTRTASTKDVVLAVTFTNYTSFQMALPPRLWLTVSGSLIDSATDKSNTLSVYDNASLSNTGLVYRGAVLSMSAATVLQTGPQIEKIGIWPSDPSFDQGETEIYKEVKLPPASSKTLYVTINTTRFVLTPDNDTLTVSLRDYFWTANRSYYQGILFNKNLPVVGHTLSY